jgi:hypothetical protein
VISTDLNPTEKKLLDWVVYFQEEWLELLQEEPGTPILLEQLQETCEPLPGTEPYKNKAWLRVMDWLTKNPAPPEMKVPYKNSPLPLLRRSSVPNNPQPAWGLNLEDLPEEAVQLTQSFLGTPTPTRTVPAPRWDPSKETLEWRIPVPFSSPDYPGGQHVLSWVHLLPTKAQEDCWHVCLYQGPYANIPYAYSRRRMGDPPYTPEEAWTQMLNEVYRTHGRWGRVLRQLGISSS